MLSGRCASESQFVFSDWCVQPDMKAIGRVHSMSQNHPVQVHMLYMEGVPSSWRCMTGLCTKQYMTNLLTNTPAFAVRVFPGISAVCAPNAVWNAPAGTIEEKLIQDHEYQMKLQGPLLYGAQSSETLSAEQLHRVLM